MATPKKYGPYTGSKQNGGRKIVVIRKADGSTTSRNAARDKVDPNGKLPKSTHVHHKDGNHSHDSKSNLAKKPAKWNIADGNKRRKAK